MCPQARLEGYASAYLPVPFVFFTNGVADSFIACAILATVHRALVTALVAVSHSDVSFILNPDNCFLHFSYLRLTMHSSAAWFFCISVPVAGGDPLPRNMSQWLLSLWASQASRAPGKRTESCRVSYEAFKAHSPCALSAETRSISRCKEKLRTKLTWKPDGAPAAAGASVTPKPATASLGELSPHGSRPPEGCGAVPALWFCLGLRSCLFSFWPQDLVPDKGIWGFTVLTLTSFHLKCRIWLLKSP